MLPFTIKFMASKSTEQALTCTDHFAYLSQDSREQKACACTSYSTCARRHVQAHAFSIGRGISQTSRVDCFSTELLKLEVYEFDDFNAELHTRESSITKPVRRL